MTGSRARWIFCPVKKGGFLSKLTNYLVMITSCLDWVIWKNITGWWFNQPIWKIWSSNWNSSPNGGENKQYLKPPPRSTLPFWNSFMKKHIHELNLQGVLVLSRVTTPSFPHNSSYNWWRGPPCTYRKNNIVCQLGGWAWTKKWRNHTQKKKNQSWQEKSSCFKVENHHYQRLFVTWW